MNVAVVVAAPEAFETPLLAVAVPKQGKTLPAALAKLDARRGRRAGARSSPPGSSPAAATSARWCYAAGDPGGAHPARRDGQARGGGPLRGAAGRRRRGAPAPRRSAPARSPSRCPAEFRGDA